MSNQPVILNLSPASTHVLTGFHPLILGTSWAKTENFSITVKRATRKERDAARNRHTTKRNGVVDTNAEAVLFDLAVESIVDWNFATADGARIPTTPEMKKTVLEIYTSLTGPLFTAAVADNRDWDVWSAEMAKNEAGEPILVPAPEDEAVPTEAEIAKN